MSVVGNEYCGLYMDYDVQVKIIDWDKEQVVRLMLNDFFNQGFYRFSVMFIYKCIFTSMFIQFMIRVWVLCSVMFSKTIASNVFSLFIQFLYSHYGILKLFDRSQFMLVDAHQIISVNQ